MKLLPGNIKSSKKLIIDTSTFFSAMYNREGNEAHLFELADIGKCSIHIADYVLDEMQEVFRRKKIDFELVLELLDTYNNIHVHELTALEAEEIKLAVDLIGDIEDRPVFIFALRMINKYQNSYFISGDKAFFKSSVKKVLKERVFKTIEVIDMIYRDEV